MPWEKQFDTEQALERAMTLFWRKGYESTSIQDLVDALGVQRGSLYATFGSKRGLFLESLRRYDATHRDTFTTELGARRTGREAILAAFDAVYSTTLKDGSRDGCLLVNTALELSAHDEEIAGVVGDALTRVEEFFRSALRRGQAEGNIAKDVDATSTARALLGLFVSLRVFARSRPERPLFRSIVRQAEALLG